MSAATWPSRNIDPANPCSLPTIGLPDAIQAISGSGAAVDCTVARTISATEATS